MSHKPKSARDQRLVRAFEEVADKVKSGTLKSGATAFEREVPDVAAIRQRQGLSQQAFADAFGISVGTLRNWEQGRREPDGPARLLLEIIDRRPDVAFEVLSGTREMAVPGRGFGEGLAGQSRFGLMPNWPALAVTVDADHAAEFRNVAERVTRHQAQMAENMAAFAEVARKVQMETVELMMAAGADLPESFRSAMAESFAAEDDGEAEQAGGFTNIPM